MFRKGLTLIEAMVVVVVISILIMLLLPAHLRSRPYAPRGICASNLKQIFTSMYTYSQDYKGSFPRVLSGAIIIGEDKAVRNLKPGLVEDTFKDFPAGAHHSVSENLWLLCRGEFSQSEIFICPSTPEAGSRIDLKDGAGGGLKYFVNFPWKDPGVTISYSFIQPWSRFGDKSKGSWDVWSADGDPQLALGADANNGSRPDFKDENNPLFWKETKKYVNSTNHDGEGQNVMWSDGHTTYEKSSYVGIDLDNIYTAVPEGFTGKSGDTPGLLSVRPKNATDSVLIPNKDADLAKWNRKP
jgi:prepilin-type N-terminal cleavage/methylation domain-containing protein